MKKQPTVLADATYRELKRARYTIAVLPWGATEPHNYHLPYGNDNFETEYIASESARRAAERGTRIVVLPCIPFGVNTSQLDLPLTINMNPSTQQAVLEDVVSSLEHHGIPRLVILNGHGGNDFKQMIRELQPKHSIFLCSVNWYRAVDLAEYFDRPGDHADEMETSVMLHIAPDKVRPLSTAGEGRERRLKLRGFREGWAWTPRDWTKVTDDTGTGNPKAATAEKGRRYLDAVTAKIADFLYELDRTRPGDLYE